MEEDWWPDLLAHIAKERPWDQPHVVVARIEPFDDLHFPGVRMSRTALVPSGEREAIKDKLRGFAHEVSATGPRPGWRNPGDYEPRFWIQGIDLPQTRYEPLVLSWESGDLTTLQIDPGFLMTYGLSPRHIEGRQLHYDDPAAPQYDVVRQTSPSRHDAGDHQPGGVSVERDYLQDYLTLRGMLLVEVYYESRRGDHDAAIEAVLGDSDGENIHLSDREFQIQRRHGGGYIAQVWGARIVAGPSGLPVSDDPLDETGLVWPGIEGTVDNNRARGFRPYDTVVVRDEVLGAYEGKPGYDVYPESGGVSFRNQWGVHWCRRVGRDLIELEIKKIYEAAPPRVIRHWNSYAVVPPANLGDPAFVNAPNIGSRARSTIEALARLGDKLAVVAARFALANVEPDDFTRVDRRALAGNDWWRLEKNAAIGRQVSLTLSERTFLERCVSLANVVLEGLGERPLRRLVEAAGVDTGGLRSLHLLNWQVRLAEVSIETGLKLEDADLLQRLMERDENRPLNHLFALNDLRQLGSHDARQADQRLRAALERFGIQPGAVAGGYGLALDRVYDRVLDDLRSAADCLEQASQI